MLSNAVTSSGYFCICPPTQEYKEGVGVAPPCPHQLEVNVAVAPKKVNPQNRLSHHH